MFAIILTLSLCTGGLDGGDDAGASGGGGGSSMGDAGGGGGGVNASDGGLLRDPLEVWADLSWSGLLSVATVVWVDDRRDTGFGSTRRRGPDLWVNSWLPDAGLSEPFGQIVCRTSAQETFSEPRIVTSALNGATVAAWRVAKRGSEGHSIRVALVDAGGTFSSCNTELVPNDGTPIAHLQLRESNGDFLVLWETPATVSAQFVATPPQQAFPVTLKSTVGSTVFPSLTGTPTGFFAAWTQQDQYVGVVITNRDKGGMAQSPLTYFPALTASHAIAMAPPLSGAFLSRVNGAPRVFTGVFDSTAISVPVAGPVAGTHALVGASLPVASPPGAPPRLYVAHQTSTAGRFAVSEFSSSVRTLDFPAGLEPLSMVSDSRRVLTLLGGPRNLTVQGLTPSGLASEPGFGVAVSNRSLPHQLHPSAAWGDAGTFLVAWNEGSNVVGAVLPAATGELGNRVSTQEDAGTFIIEPVASGTGLAVNVFGNGYTGVFLATNGPNGLIKPAFLSTVGEHPATLVGTQLAAVWTPGDDQIVVGRGPSQARAISNARLGRCGAYASGALFIPMVIGDELAVLEVTDSLDAPNPQMRALGTLARVAPPCLVARGDELLLVTHENLNLVVARTNVSDVRAGIPPQVLRVPTQPGSRAVFEPVAAVTGRGWQLAWESPDETGSVILGMQLGLEGEVFDGNVLSTGVDERAPRLISSQGGPIALVWQHFVDRTGNVVVQARVLPAEVVPEPDGGLADGGLADGGFVIEPLVYSTCGCQSGDATALFALVLLVLTSRRASTRS